MNTVRKAEAIKYFGRQVVSEVISVVKMSDPDGAYTMFEDMGEDEKAECVEMLFFNCDEESETELIEESEDYFFDLYTDGYGNCFSDADSGL